MPDTEKLSAAQRSKVRRLSRPRELAPDEEGGELNIVPFLDIITNVLMFVLATISVTTGTATCSADRLPCTSSTSVTGLIRSSRNQMSRIVVSDANAGSAPFAITCSDRSIGTLHGALTLATDAILAPGSDVNCASWAANPAGNVIAVDNLITFTSAESSLLNFTVSLVVS